MKYKELKDKQEKEYNEFTSKYIFFAFIEEQFLEDLKKLNCAGNELYRLGDSGGFILKYRSPEHHKLIDKFERELDEHMKDLDFAREAIKYEMGNYEYVYNHNDKQILSILNLWEDGVGLKDKKYLKHYNEVKKDYLENVIA